MEMRTKNHKKYSTYRKYYFHMKTEKKKSFFKHGKKKV